MNYQQLYADILGLNRNGFDFFSLGSSTLGAPIFAVHLGSYRGPQQIVQGAIHAREYITAPLVVRLANYTAQVPFLGGIYFIPLLNPDGARLCLEGAEFVAPATRKAMLKEVNGGTDFSLWKANANAVDLNNNFPAGWGQGVGNRTTPASAGYIGTSAASEKESKLLLDFTLFVRPAVTLSFHTKGEVIYYGYPTESAESAKKSRNIAYLLAKSAGYLAMESTASRGGYKDWCVDTLKIPAFTIEVGSDNLAHPLVENSLNGIFERTKNLPLIAQKEV